MKSYESRDYRVEIRDLKYKAQRIKLESPVAMRVLKNPSDSFPSD